MLQAIKDISWDNPPPEFARAMLLAIYKICGTIDIYREEKDTCTILARKIADSFTDTLDKMNDPFPALVKLAIGGNILDYSIDDSLDLVKAKERMEEVFSLPVNTNDLEQLRTELDNAKSIFYILDNCGEAVLDSLFVKQYRGKIALGVRGGPVLNDVTRREIEASGLNGFPVFDTGDLTPGVLEKHTSPSFLNAMRSADIVVAKGQGNFETLGDYHRPIFFLFRAKCPVIQNCLGGVIPNSLQIIRKA